MKLSLVEILLIHFITEYQINGVETQCSLQSPDDLIAALDDPDYRDDGTDECRRAAVLAHRIITGRVFHTGNGRVGILAGLVHLLMNGYRLNADPDAVSMASYEIAQGEWDQQKLTDWFEFHARKI
jgi:prophage maintenance system killer protein